MKIKVKDLSYEEAMKRSIRYQSKKHVKPKKPNMFFRKLMNAMSKSELKAVNFKYEKIPKRNRFGIFYNYLTSWRLIFLVVVFSNSVFLISTALICL